VALACPTTSLWQLHTDQRQSPVGPECPSGGTKLHVQVHTEKVMRDSYARSCSSPVLNITPLTLTHEQLPARGEPCTLLCISFGCMLTVGRSLGRVRFFVLRRAELHPARSIRVAAGVSLRPSPGCRSETSASQAHRSVSSLDYLTHPHIPCSSILAGSFDRIPVANSRRRNRHTPFDFALSRKPAVFDGKTKSYVGPRVGGLSCQPFQNQPLRQTPGGIRIRRLKLAGPRIQIEICNVAFRLANRSSQTSGSGSVRAAGHFNRLKSRKLG
jgi:hypothetical protein